MEKNGINELYPPQVKAVKSGLLEGENIVLAVPTASGKTLAAELAMTKKILEEGGKALYMVPLRALATEKYREFLKYTETGIKVAISTGDYDSSDPWLANYDIIVVTNEKADSLLRHRPTWMSRISIIVADEVHIINDSSRGPTLEMVLAKLKYVNPKAQIIALSATIRNAEEIAEWLGSKIIKSEWRPVPLKKGVYFRNRIIYDDGEIVEVSGNLSEPCQALVNQTLKEGGQVLIFTNTRENAKRQALRLATLTSKYLKKGERKELKALAEEILKTGETTRISEQLSTCVANGIAFHHAGLIYQHRKIIEDAFRDFKIKVICATPTLAAGVNLPARRVIIKSYYRYSGSFGSQPIPVLEYHQMAGRAGRPKYDDMGDAILIAKTRDEREFLFENYVKAPPEKIWSKLAAESALRSHILAAIATDFARTERGLMDFMAQTFYYHQYGGSIYIESIIRSILKFLEENEMIRIDENHLKATKIGIRVSQLYIDPLSAVYMMDGLEKRRKATEIAYLHLVATTPDMPKLFLRRGERRKLTEKALKIQDELLVEPPDPYINADEYDFFLASLKTALTLYDWINEMKEDDIIAKYRIGSGDIYSLASTAKWLIYSAAEISKLLKLRNHIKPLRQLMLRIQYGCKPELLEIVQLKGIGRIRARMLYNAGYRTIQDLKKTRIEDLLKIPTIGKETVKSIIEQIGRENEKVKVEEKRDEQKRIIEYFEKRSKVKNNG